MYQRLEYRDNYFFKIKFVFFLNLLLSASWKENDLPLYISDITQILGTEHQYLFSRFHITITYNLPHLQLWNADASTTMKCWRCHNNSVNTGSRLPSVSDVKTRKRWNVVGIDMIRNNRIGQVWTETTIGKRRLNQVQRRHSHVSISSMHDNVNNLNKMETITDNNTGELSYWKYNH